MVARNRAHDATSGPNAQTQQSFNGIYTETASGDCATFANKVGYKVVQNVIANIAAIQAGRVSEFRLMRRPAPAR